MIFNRDSNGAEELHLITGNYYASNDFLLIEQDIRDATDDVARTIGRPLMEKVDKAYNSISSEDLPDADTLIPLVQRPVALLACVRFFRRNDVSHEDSGRKVKVSTDDSEKIPWEWQLDRDDEVHMEQYYRSMERLIAYLNDTKNKDWLETESVKLAGTLIIRDADAFERYFPIQSSARLYLLLVPFIREVQIRAIRPAYGAEKWPELLKDASVPETDTHFAACKATALLAMSQAIRRMPLQLIPSGVIRGYLAENGMGASVPASLDEVARLSSWLEADAADWLERMKVFRDGDSGDLEVLPKNAKRNKYFVT